MQNSVEFRRICDFVYFYVLFVLFFFKHFLHSKYGYVNESV